MKYSSVELVLCVLLSRDGVRGIVTHSRGFSSSFSRWRQHLESLLTLSQLLFHISARTSGGPELEWNPSMTAKESTATAHVITTNRRALSSKAADANQRSGGRRSTILFIVFLWFLHSFPVGWFSAAHTLYGPPGTWHKILLTKRIIISLFYIRYHKFKVVFLNKSFELSSCWINLFRRHLFIIIIIMIFMFLYVLDVILFSHCHELAGLMSYTNRRAANTHWWHREQLGVQCLAQRHLNMNSDLLDLLSHSRSYDSFSLRCFHWVITGCTRHTVRWFSFCYQWMWEWIWLFSFLPPGTLSWSSHDPRPLSKPLS